MTLYLYLEVQAYEFTNQKDRRKIGVEFSNGYKSDTLPHWELCITTEEDIFKLPRKLEKYVRIESTIIMEQV